MSARFLSLPLILIAASCHQQSLTAGSFHVAFSWAAGAPPNLQWPVFLSAQVVDETNPSKPNVLDQPPAVAYTPGTPTEISFSGNFYGNNRVVIANLYQTSDLANSPIVAYGQSDPFSVTPGHDTAVNVALEFQLVPGESSPTADSIDIEWPGTPGYIDSENVTLVLKTDTGVSVLLANELEGLSSAAPLSLISSDGGVFPQAWDLNLNLSPLTSEACDVSTAPTGCLRQVWAEFVDAHGYTSSAVSVQAILDEVPAAVTFAAVTYTPGPGNPVVTPTAATYGTIITVEVTPNEAIDPTRTVSLVAQGPTGPPLSFALLGPPRADGATFQATVPATWPAVGPSILTPAVTWTDLAGTSTQTATFASPAITVETLSGAPAPDTAANGPITYARVPWGSTATGGLPQYSVTATAGAAHGAAALVVYDAPDTATASQLGVGLVDSAGEVVDSDGGMARISLVQTDHTVVFLASADSAGNVSPTMAAHNVSWTASFDGKLPGDTQSNPNVLLADMVSPLSPAFGDGVAGPLLFAPSSAGPPLANEVASYAPVPLISFRQPWSNVDNGQSPGSRTDHAMVYDSARGVTVLFGGLNNGGNLNDDTWEWNGTAWSEVTEEGAVGSPAARYCEAMAYDRARGVTVLFGGVNNSGELNDTWQWDGATWNLIRAEGASGSPQARDAHAMAYDSVRGVTVLFGGVNLNGTDFNDTWEWNGATWSEVTRNGAAGSPPRRDFHAMAYDSARGVMVLFGGRGDGNGDLNDTWEWNGTAWSEVTQSGAAGSPPARDGHAMWYDSARGVTVLFGGENDISGSDFNDTWEWNGARWSEVTQNGDAGGPPPRDGHATVYDSAHGIALLFGGEPGVGDLFQDTWEWNGTSWIDVAAGSLTARNATAMAYDSARGMTVLFGGEEEESAEGPDAGMETELVNDTREWNGAVWNQTTATGASGSPPPRAYHAMAYDSARAVTVLFGGEKSVMEADGGTDAEPVNDTWEWNGTAWSPVTANGASGSPAARAFHAMAYDSERGATVLFGGLDDIYGSIKDSTLNDTWEWNGTIWSEITVRGAPASPRARELHAMAYDSERGVTVLFGGLGFDNGNVNLNDTWEWNGAIWKQVTPNGSSGSPTARNSHAMVYDSARGVTVLFGGQNSSGELNDTWEWNGTTWNEVAATGAPGSPPTRVSPAMAYDSARRATVVFGGQTYTPDEFLGDTWLFSDALADRPAEVAQFQFSATGETSSSAMVQSMLFTVAAGGLGYSAPEPPALGTPASGVVLAAWDEGAWHVLQTNDAGPSAPAAMTYTTASPSEAASYLLGGPWQTINVACFPATPTGNGPSPGEVSVTDPEVTVRYIHSESQCSAGVDGGCLCASDETVCVPDGGPTICSDLRTDPQNCGACVAACSGGQWCIDAGCQCPPNETACGGTCTDTSLDPLNCGSCNMVCPAGASCTAQGCQCPSGSTSICSGECSNPQTDSNNCGSCGHACPSGQQCSSGMCQPAGTCLNTTNDWANCGACGNQCAAGQTCAGGTCVTPDAGS